MVGYTKKGEAFLFDIDYYDIVSKHTWYISKRGYVTTSIKRKPVPMHKLLIKNTEGYDIDHVSRDRLDNRKQNLRICTHQENTFNQKKRITNSTGLIGVSFMKNAGAYESYIHYNGKKYHLGLYKNKIEAAMERDKAALEYFGEYANLNFSKEMTG